MPGWHHFCEIGQELIGIFSRKCRGNAIIGAKQGSKSAHPFIRPSVEVLKAVTSDEWRAGQVKGARHGEAIGVVSPWQAARARGIVKGSMDGTYYPELLV